MQPEAGAGGGQAVIRAVFWMVVWVLGLGLFRFHVVYKDGLTISLAPWTDLFRREAKP